MVKATAAKDVDAAQSAAARPAPASQEEASRTKVLKCSGFRGEMKSKDGKQVIFCKVCKKDYSFAGWGQHCSKSHKGYNPPADRSENIDDRDDDDAKQLRPRTEQMVRQSTRCRRSTKHHKRNQRDATDRKSPKPRRRNVAKRTLSKNRTQVQRRRKAKPRLRKNCGQRSSCRTADSCVNLNKSYLSMYHNLFFLCEKHVHSEHVFI